MLSGLSRGAGLVIATKADMVLKHIEFVRLDQQSALAILVGQDGQVENRVVALPPGLTASALTQASNYLATLAIGRTISEARTALSLQRAEQRAELDALANSLVEQGLATLSTPLGTATPTVIVRGRANLINDAMASDDLARMRKLFDELESKEGLMELLGDAEKAQGVRIFIGSENKLFSLSRLLGDPQPLQGRERKSRRRPRRHRPHPLELRPHRPGGRLHRARDQPDDGAEGLAPSSPSPRRGVPKLEGPNRLRRSLRCAREDKRGTTGVRNYQNESSRQSQG